MIDFIPWLDLTRQYRTLQPSLLPVVDELMAKSRFILGGAVERFEADFARFVGARHCIAVNSGTSALHLALRVCDVGPGDEVITVPATWISTCWAISYAGARPVFVDIEPGTWCMDPENIEAAITPRTRAILPVHLYGQMANMPGIVALARRHGLAVIEDACQAHAATLFGRHAGTFGRIGCFSYFPGKNLGAYGEAGAVVTDDDALAQRVRRLRDHAQACRHVHVELGYNKRMEGFQGAVLSVKLPHLPAWTDARRQIACSYSEELTDLPGVSLPVERHGGRHNWHIYALCSDERDDLRSFLAGRGIQTSIHYPTPVHLQPAYRHLGYRPGDFPVSESLCRSQITLPMFPELTRAEVNQVIGAVRQWAGSAQERLLTAA
jgi:dTDP-4-amino-4,6-dideoxygalactose transaminase